MRIRIFLLAVAISAATLAPPSANSVVDPPSCSQPSCGTVQTKDFTHGIFIRLKMSGGYGMQATAGNRFTFNRNTRLTPGLSSFSMTAFCPTAASLRSKTNDSAGKFTWGIAQCNPYAGTASVSGSKARLRGFDTSDLLANKDGNVVAVHYCLPVNGSVYTSTCSPNTDFASLTPTSPVTEAGTLSLLGTSLLTLAGVVRRCFPG